jgi:hypothetical protein
LKTWTQGILTSLLMGARVLVSLPAFAAGPYYHLNHREVRFQPRIYRGLCRGGCPQEKPAISHISYIASAWLRSGWGPIAGSAPTIATIITTGDRAGIRSMKRAGGGDSPPGSRYNFFL